MVEDFMEIVLLCGNGYGVGALKLLRGLYERAVAARYLSKHPSEVDRFLDYHHIQEWKLYQRVLDVYKESPLGISTEHVDRMKREYDRVKAGFSEPLCVKCGTNRTQISWSRLDTFAMALKAGEGLEQLYMSCYLVPTLQAHATVSSLVTRMKRTPEGGLTFDEGPQRSKAQWALVSAHTLILQAIDTQNSHFELDLGARISQASDDFVQIWKSPRSSPPNTTEMKPGPS